MLQNGFEAVANRHHEALVVRQSDVFDHAVHQIGQVVPDHEAVDHDLVVRKDVKNKSQFHQATHHPGKRNCVFFSALKRYLTMLHEHFSL